MAHAMLNLARMTCAMRFAAPPVLGT